MKTKTNITASQVLKSGVNPKTNKAWTLFKYTIDPVTVDGESFNSFTSFTGHEEGPVELDLEVNVNGQWKNLREVAPQSPMGKKFADLEKRVKALEDLTKKGKIEPEIPIVNSDLDIDF